MGPGAMDPSFSSVIGTGIPDGLELGLRDCDEVR